MCGSTGENMSGSVRTVRNFAPLPVKGDTSCDFPVDQWNLETSVRPAPYMMSGSIGSGATYPYSIAPTGCHSRMVISPSFPRLEMHTDPLSCCPPHTRYGNPLLALT